MDAAVFTEDTGNSQPMQCAHTAAEPRVAASGDDGGAGNGRDLASGVRSRAQRRRAQVSWRLPMLTARLVQCGRSGTREDGTPTARLVQWPHALDASSAWVRAAQGRGE
jgi:hypothetical protein